VVLVAAMDSYWDVQRRQPACACALGKMKVLKDAQGGVVTVSAVDGVRERGLLGCVAGLVEGKWGR
jgi:hypothetical protein